MHKHPDSLNGRKQPQTRRDGEPEEDIAVFERNIRLRHEDAERNRNERHRNSQSIMRERLALIRHIANQNIPGHIDNNNNDNDNNE